ncbi:glycine--tRNA ligase subunit beta [Candidatus Methylocalor cossyra]|uniref:Glycine--tRNA ligase beta subunit n=1 Tax=Candidatus Methylocalor cossyra TaxID=3108543 RepID=A0ABM9NFU1_9GAMM
MTETRDLLFELGTEELPPKSLFTLALALKTNIEAGLAKAALEHGALLPYATPRRLAVLVKDLATAQADRIEERRGPAVSSAYRADGSPTPALEGFLRSCGATPEQVFTLQTEKGEWLVVRQAVRGVPTVELIPEILRQALTALPIAKRMRWGSGTAEFVRPVQWAVLLFGDELIPAEFLGVRTGRETRGHRFHHPGPISLARPADYPDQLAERGFVIAEFDARRRKVRALVEAAAATVDGVAEIEPELLDETTALVEWPVAVLGGFDARYLALPPEVLITTLQSHQKYFPVKDRHGALLPYFVTVSNIESTAPATVRAGNERVVRPRLADAEFFWNQDRKRPLESRVEELAQLTFQKTLGSMWDKTRRTERLAVAIAERLGTESAWVERAARLAKADLLTLMVGEFPELQGIMGRYYALAEGEPEEIAAAIEEQYRPRVSGGPLPTTRTGLMLALAEKLDTLAGIFSVGLAPTGDKDPYALRRAALGVIRLLVEAELDLHLPDLLDLALSQFGHRFDAAAVKASLWEFLLERLRGYFLERHVRPDEFEAVLSVAPASLLDFARRLKAVAEFRKLPEAESLATANKRIRNILRRAQAEIAATVDPGRFVEPSESRLLEAARAAKADILPLLHARDYTGALCRLSRLREVVDSFFDGVMVMAEDAALRQNRLGLLAIVEGLFLDIADISKLQG